MKRLMQAAALLLAAATGVWQPQPGQADTRDIANCDGYPCVNFTLGANVSLAGEVFPRLFFNPPQLGAGLEPIVGGRFTYLVDEAELTAADCDQRRVSRRWPFAQVELSDPALRGVDIRVRTLVPIGIDDVVVSSLPVALAEFTFTNSSDQPRTITVSFDAASFLGATPRPLSLDGVRGLRAAKNFAAWLDGAALQGPGERLTATVSLAPGAGEQRRFIIGHYEDGWPSSAQLGGVEALAAYVAREWGELQTAATRFDERLPRTGDHEIDEYVRWYTTAGVALTRVLKDGTALTMGYVEFNQRDSYWTTWVHLALWPSIERRMIEESVRAQRPDGKIPTTILPVIEREDDVDINCYFILRGLRYARFHHDDEFGRSILPSLKRAADWLIARDADDEGLPQAASYWYDWKDVSGVQGRKYSPHAAMLYVAALGRLGDYCAQLGDAQAAEQYRRHAARGRELLDRPVSDGGLWNGSFYQEVWHDGRSEPACLQDQAVGIVLEAISAERGRSVLAALRASQSPWGVRETYPYRPDSFGNVGGDYHNGGIWPWVNHLHAWANFCLGEKEAGLQMIRRVAHADLELMQDYIPNEYLNGQSGRQQGVPMQGWNANLFGTVYFGLQRGAAAP